MVSDQVDDWATRSSGIVQIGNTVGQTRTQMQQSGRRFTQHPAVTVGSTSANSLKQRQNRPYCIVAINGLNQMHFRRTRICETDFNAAFNQRPQQTFSSIHDNISLSIVGNWH
jgi:hypothetical protein